MLALKQEFPVGLWPLCGPWTAVDPAVSHLFPRLGQRTLRPHKHSPSSSTVNASARGAPTKKIRGHQLLLTKRWYAHNVIIVVSFILVFCIPLENCLLILPLCSGDHHSHYISVLLYYYWWWCPYHHLWYSHGSHHVYLYCYLLSNSVIYSYQCC